MKKKFVHLCALTAVGAGALGTQVAPAQIVNWKPAAKMLPADSSQNVAQQPVLATDHNGNVVCVYQAVGAGIRSVSSSTNGRSWNDTFSTVIQGNFTNTALATDGQGTWVTMFSESFNGGASAFSATSTDNGATWSSAVFIADSLFPNHSLEATTDIALACNNDGVWLAALKTSSDGDHVIAILKSENNGASWSPVLLIPNPRDASTVSVTANKNAQFMVVYESISTGSETDSSDIGFVTFDIAGNTHTMGAVGADAATDSITDLRPSVTSTAEGGWVVGWGSQDMVFVSSSANGVNWTPRAAIAPDGQVNFSSPSLIDPDIASGEDGTLLALWSSLPTVGSERVMYHSLQVSPLSLEAKEPGPVDSERDTIPPKFTYGPSVIQGIGGRWIAAWQDLPGPATQSSSPWFAHGVKDGALEGDLPTDADIQLTKTVYPDTAVAGKKLGYVITVKNLETTMSANMVKIEDVLPTAFQFEHAVVSQGTWSNANGTITANLGPLPPGGKATLSIAMTAQGTIGQTITNTASATLFGTDPNPDNNTASASTTIGEETVDPENPGEPGDPGDPETTPSLSLAFSKVAVKGKEPKPGKPAKPYKITAKTAATNISQAVTTPTVVMLYLSDDDTLDGADTLIAQKTLKPIKPGKAKKANLSAKVAGNPAGKYLIAVIPGEARIAYALGLPPV